MAVTEKLKSNYTNLISHADKKEVSTDCLCTESVTGEYNDEWLKCN